MSYKIFIGSSGESKLIAAALSAALSDREFDCEAWFDGLFEPGNVTHAALVERAPLYDFAVFLVTADDELVHKTTHIWVPRDNVVWELGLFTGALGPHRCFLAYDDNSKPKLPTDYAGVGVVRFKTQDDVQSGKTNWQKTMAVVANKIHLSAQKTGSRTLPVSLPSKLERELQRIRTSAESVKLPTYSKHEAFQIGIHSLLRGLREASTEWLTGSVTILQGYIEMVELVYRKAERNVFSTCITEYIQLFNSPFGAIIMRAHKNNKSAEVTRVFIFNHAGDEAPHRQVLEAQRRAGVRVLLYFDKDDDTFNFPPKHGNDWTVIDDGDIIGVTKKFGTEYEAQWHFDHERKKVEFQDLINRLSAVSFEFKP